jgi:hypothetical protein
MGRSGKATVCQDEIKELTALIDRTEQVLPHTARPNISLIDAA